MPQSAEVLKRRKKHQLGGFEKTLTVQSEKDKCCINHIMAKYTATGQIDHMRDATGQYLDVSTVEDFQSSMNTVVKTQQQFELLPAEIRKQFDNDPAQFLGFVSDANNKDEMIKMGLVIDPDAAKSGAKPDAGTDPAPEGHEGGTPDPE